VAGVGEKEEIGAGTGEENKLLGVCISDWPGNFHHHAGFDPDGDFEEVMKLGEFDYQLPKELIAQEPVRPRDRSRLMIVNRLARTIEHDYFYNLPKYLRRDDLLVFNDTKVFPARLVGKKESGGRVEILLLTSEGGGWRFIGKNIGRAKRVIFGNGLEGEIVRPGVIKFNVDSNRLTVLIDRIGYTPVPPYIHPRGAWPEPKLRRMYQTVYAREFRLRAGGMGSAAAPTAGFHFTKKMLAKIPKKIFVTLWVGLGTFAPVREENIEEHKMHEERFSISSGTRAEILRAKKGGERIVAVGTTSVRVLESDWTRNETNIFIYPGYKFKYVDTMITNFHLPKSTLLILVCAFAGKELVMKAYEEAIKKKYRFYSFGDAMLVV